MRRMIYGLLALLALCAVPQWVAAADWMASVQGGASVPTGDFADKAKADAQTGWSLGGSVDYPWKDEWAFGLDASWNQNGRGAEGEVTDLGGGNTSTVDKDKFKVWQLGAHATYYLPVSSQAPVKWYGVIGGSLYGFSEDRTVTVTSGGTPTSTTTKGADKRAGLKLGLGGTYWVPNSQVGVNVGADYNMAFLDKDQSTSSSLSYVGAYVGLTFKIPQGK